jgi:hypothetical protein
MLSSARPRVEHEMGKRVLASDEFELRSLRIRFLAASEQITGQLAALARRIGGAPPAAQASLLVLAGQIAAAQQRLRDETDRLVMHRADCAAILPIILQAQLAVSSQLANILGADHTLSHLGSKLANIAQELARVHGPDPSRVGDQTWETWTQQGEHDDRADVEANASDFPVGLTPNGEEFSRIFEPNPAYPTLLAKIGAGLSVVAAAATFRSLAVTGCLLCSLIVAYAHLYTSDQQAVATRSLPASEPKIAAAPRVRSSQSRPQLPEARTAYAQAIRPEAEDARTRDLDLSVSAAPEPTPPPFTAHASILLIPERNAGPVPQADNWGGTVTSAQSLAVNKPIPTTPSYVPVVFTHKDKHTAERAFAELQLQYPKLLRNRQSGLKVVNVGEKGIWYRVFILPPGTRQQATESCARLAAAGHDRCWVKEY